MKKLLMIIPLVILLCFTFGCQDKEAMAELEKFKAQAEVEEQNKVLVKRMYEAFEKGDRLLFSFSLMRLLRFARNDNQSRNDNKFRNDNK